MKIALALFAIQAYGESCCNEHLAVNGFITDEAYKYIGKKIIQRPNKKKPLLSFVSKDHGQQECALKCKDNLQCIAYFQVNRKCYLHSSIDWDNDNKKQEIKNGVFGRRCEPEDSCRRDTRPPKYGCAGLIPCIDSKLDSNDAQPNGNALCATNFIDKNVAELVCRLFRSNRLECDGIIVIPGEEETYELVVRYENGMTETNECEGWETNDFMRNVKYELVSQTKYSCAGDSICLDSPDLRRNVLCSINYTDKTEAHAACRDLVSRGQHCDGLIVIPGLQETYELVTKNEHNGCPWNYKTEKTKFEPISSRPVRDITNLDRESESKRNLFASESNKQSVTRIINGHGPVPFEQKETHYPEHNITEFIVGAHLHYSENTIYKDHSKKVIIAVVQDTCIFVNDPVPDVMLDPEADLFVGPEVTKENTEHVDMKISYVESTVDLNEYSKLIRDACHDKRILEQAHDLKDLVPDTMSATFKIPLEKLETNARPVQFNENQRKRRVASVSCRKSLCGTTAFGMPNYMYSQCTSEDCMRDGRWCYYIPNNNGGRGTTTNKGEGEDRVNFWHFTFDGFMCMPCCLFGPTTDSRMPACNQIAFADQLCNWMRRNGRCGTSWGA